VIAAHGMLLLADPAVAREFEARIGDGRCIHRADPYEALEEMSARAWSAVVLTAPRADFAGLCRAFRRLGGAAKLMALCATAAEPEVRTMVGGLLDDYYVWPPTGADWQALQAAAAGAEPIEPAAAGAGQVEPAVASQPAVAQPGAPAAGRLGPADFAGLVAAARSPAALEDYLKAVLAPRAGVKLWWIDQAAVTGGAKVLLKIPGDRDRLLVASAGVVDPAVAALIGEIQQCLDALIASARRTERLGRLAVTDHLTGAHNRRYFYRMTDRILQRTRRGSPHVTLLLYDIDNFKRYNDTYGHAAGDDILRATAGLMKRITRRQDIVARIGGDEFAVLFWDDEQPRQPDSRPPETALALADRFRIMVEQHEYPSLGPEASGVLTISGGLATFPQDGRTCKELLRKADLALREAKLSGKNSIHLVGGATGRQVTP